MKKIIEFLLAFFAKAIIRKYKPEIVGITGSLGKTSTTNAIYAVLSAEYNVRQNPKNYNNEIGLPLTIINAQSGEKNPFKWLLVFFQAINLLFFQSKDYPEILVLEMGADMKGDIDYLTNIAPPDIGVLTTVSETHLQSTNPKALNKENLWFKNIQGVLKEKKLIVSKLSDDKVAILNYDDENVISLRDKIKAKVVTFGFSNEASVKAGDLFFSGLVEDFCQTDYSFDCKVWGVNFKVTYNGSSVPVFLPRCFGKHHVYAALAAISVGVAKGMNLVDIADALRNYQPSPGRMSLIPGIKHTLIIDDTYNSPAARAVITGLEVMSQINLPEGRRKIAVLGDMLELGETSEEAHREVGFKIAELGIDYLITVGQNMTMTAAAALEAGLAKENVEAFSDRDKAGRFLQDILAKGDLVFIKGSQGVRMEKVVKEVMAEPEKAADLLVRQSDSWQANTKVDVTQNK